MFRPSWHARRWTSLDVGLKEGLLAQNNFVSVRFSGGSMAFVPGSLGICLGRRGLSTFVCRRFLVYSSALAVPTCPYGFSVSDPVAY